MHLEFCLCSIIFVRFQDINFIVFKDELRFLSFAYSEIACIFWEKLKRNRSIKSAKHLRF